MPPHERISEMLRLASSDTRNFPATIFYNEGWLLRLVLDWFSRNEMIERSPQSLLRHCAKTKRDLSSRQSIFLA